MNTLYMTDPHELDLRDGFAPGTVVRCVKDPIPRFGYNWLGKLGIVKDDHRIYTIPLGTPVEGPFEWHPLPPTPINEIEEGDTVVCVGSSNIAAQVGDIGTVMGKIVAGEKYAVTLRSGQWAVVKKGEKKPEPGTLTHDLFDRLCKVEGWTGRVSELLFQGRYVMGHIGKPISPFVLGGIVRDCHERGWDLFDVKGGVTIYPSGDTRVQSCHHHPATRMLLAYLEAHGV